MIEESICKGQEALTDRGDSVSKCQAVCAKKARNSIQVILFQFHDFLVTKIGLKRGANIKNIS